ncbi:MAG: HEPN domain-containing protein [Anaerolineaceae bacterium]|nr:HEPN domain-containing protein [Anaerolineaceae bacterium]
MTVPEKYPITDYMQQRAQEWLQRADYLLSLLDCAPFESANPPTNLVAALANVAAEYAMKGYLMLYKQKIPRNHDLGEIYNLCMAVFKDIDFENIRSVVEELGHYRVEFDYPGFIQENIDAQEAREAIRKARIVREFIFAKTKLG